MRHSCRVPAKQMKYSLALLDFLWTHTHIAFWWIQERNKTVLLIGCSPQWNGGLNLPYYMTIHPQSPVFSVSICIVSSRPLSLVSVQRPQEILTTWLFMAYCWNTTHALNSMHPAACFCYKQEQLKWDEHSWGRECICCCNCSQQQTFREMGRDFPDAHFILAHLLHQFNKRSLA